MARRERQQSEAARKTLRQATEAYIEEKDRKWGASSRVIWRRFVDRDIEVIADVAVDTLGREHIKQAVNSLYRMKPANAGHRLVRQNSIALPASAVEAAPFFQPSSAVCGGCLRPTWFGRCRTVVCVISFSWRETPSSYPNANQ